MLQRPWLRIVLSAVVLGALAVALRVAFGAQLTPRAALATLRTVQGNWWAPVLFVLLYVPGTALFLPATLFHLVTGAAYGFWRAVLLNTLASNLAASSQFFLARHLGRGTVAKILARGKMKAFDETAARHGFRAVVTVRQLPIPHMAVNVAAGISGMSWPQFALGSLVGAMPTIVIWTYFASAVVEGVAGAERAAWLRALGCGAVMVVVSLVVPRVVRRFQRTPPPTPSPQTGRGQG